MKQADIDRAVARATGETVSTIKRLGFLLADSNGSLGPDPDEQGPFIIDWDDLESQRFEERTGRPRYEPVAA